MYTPSTNELQLRVSGSSCLRKFLYLQLYWKNIIYMNHGKFSNGKDRASNEHLLGLAIRSPEYYYTTVGGSD